MIPPRSDFGIIDFSQHCGYTIGDEFFRDGLTSTDIQLKAIYGFLSGFINLLSQPCREFFHTLYYRLCLTFVMDKFRLLRKRFAEICDASWPWVNWANGWFFHCWINPLQIGGQTGGNGTLFVFGVDFEAGDAVIVLGFEFGADLGAGFFVDMRDNVGRKVEHALEVTGGDVEQQAQAAR